MLGQVEAEQMGQEQEAVLGVAEEKERAIRMQKYYQGMGDRTLPHEIYGNVKSLASTGLMAAGTLTANPALAAAGAVVGGKDPVPFIEGLKKPEVPEAPPWPPLPPSVPDAPGVPGVETLPVGTGPMTPAQRELLKNRYDKGRNRPKKDDTLVGYYTGSGTY